MQKRGEKDLEGGIAFWFSTKPKLGDFFKFEVQGRVKISLCLINYMLHFVRKQFFSFELNLIFNSKNILTLNLLLV